MASVRPSPSLRRLRPPLGRLGVAVVLLAAGCLFATSARTADGVDLRGDDTDLASQVLAQQRQVAERSAQATALRTQVQALAAAVPDPTARALAGGADALAAAAGLSPVTGPGVVVSLDDAPQDRPEPAGVSQDTLIVHQQDLQAVVNALWAGGATAVELQDQRVISTSAVRCVGNTLKLQGRLYAPPYTVRAVGSPAALQAALSASPDVGAYLDDVQRVGLGWSLTTPAQVRVPAWSGPLELVHARAVPARPSSMGTATASASASAGPSASADSPASASSPGPGS